MREGLRPANRGSMKKVDRSKLPAEDPRRYDWDRAVRGRHAGKGAALGRLVRMLEPDLRRPVPRFARGERSAPRDGDVESSAAEAQAEARRLSPSRPASRCIPSTEEAPRSFRDVARRGGRRPEGDSAHSQGVSQAWAWPGRVTQICSAPQPSSKPLQVEKLQDQSHPFSLGSIGKQSQVANA